MNSVERHEVRYQRRKAKRYAAKLKRNQSLGTIEQVFNYHDMYRSGKKCCNNVRWKQSVQTFERHLFSGTAARRRKIIEGTWKCSGYAHFLLSERGKIRPIDAPTIQDRQVHKVITHKILYPLYKPSMIYDNGASQLGKGLRFSFERLKQDLRRHYRKYGCNGYIVLIDLKNFFPSVPHNIIYNRHDDLILDGKIKSLCDRLVIDFSNHTKLDKGMPLGIEPSQIEMVSLPSSVDNFAKCQLSIKAFAHYMDDYYALFNTIEEAKLFVTKINHRFNQIGLTINSKKCKITSIIKPFKYCKAKFYLTETGKVVVRGNPDNLKRARKKMKSFKIKFDQGLMEIKQIEQWYQTVIAYFSNFDDHNRILRLNRIYYNLFGGVGS